jgi:hypothetical protein
LWREKVAALDPETVQSRFLLLPNNHKEIIMAKHRVAGKKHVKKASHKRRGRKRASKKLAIKA